MSAPFTAEQEEIQAYCRRRATKAAKLLKAYDPGDVATAIGDCLADLMHLCHQRSIDFAERESNGRLHFHAELHGGEYG